MRTRFKPWAVDRGEEQDWNERQLAQPVTEPQMRFWTYRRPQIILGGGQRGSVDMEAAQQRSGISVLCRHSGGGAVLGGSWMLSMSLLLPPQHPIARRSPHAGYQLVGEAHAAALRSFGVAAMALDAPRLRALRARRAAAGSGEDVMGWACFGGLCHGEVVVGDRKIVGLAQVRRRTGVLIVSGTLLTEPDWWHFGAALERSAEDLARLRRLTVSCTGALGESIPARMLSASLGSRLSALAEVGPYAPPRTVYEGEWMDAYA